VIPHRKGLFISLSAMFTDGMAGASETTKFEPPSLRILAVPVETNAFTPVAREDSQDKRATATLARSPSAMCRNIKTLFNLAPPATEAEIRDAALQFVRKLSGFSVPSKANQAALQRAVDEVASSATVLIATLTTTAEPRDREVEAARARERSRLRFGPAG